MMGNDCLLSRNDDSRTDIMDDTIRHYFRHRPAAPARCQGGLKGSLHRSSRPAKDVSSLHSRRWARGFR